MDKNVTLLVVDNSPPNLELMRSLLEPSGYTVLTASSVADGLQLARQAVPDLIMSDVHMPGADGFEFIRRAKADPRLCGIPFAFISSTVWWASDPQKALELGAVKFIQRPIEPQQFLREVEECLKSKLSEGKYPHDNEAGA
jgi:two-component system cell cycle response regulator